MRTTHARRAAFAGLCAALTALTLAAASARAADTGLAATTSSSTAAPIVRIEGGAVGGATVSEGYEFLGLPYAAPPTGNRRWRPPQAPAQWNGVRDATQFAPSCPQPNSPFAPPGPFSENCLYLNVYTPTLRRDGHRPVLVWIHGVVSLRMGPGTTTAPSSPRTAPSWSRSTTASVRSGSLPTPHSRRDPVAPPATTA